MLPIIGHAAYGAIVSGFLMTDMLQLRLLLIGGYTGLVGFHSLHKSPLMIPLRWSAVFVLVNALGAAVLVMDRFTPTLDDVPGFESDGEHLYAEHFRSYLTRGQFHQLIKLARREKIPPGTVLTRENLPSDSVYFIVKGWAHVYHGTLKRTPTTITRAASSSSSSGGITATRRWMVHGNVREDDEEIDGSEDDGGVGEDEVMTLTPTPTTNIATIKQGGFVNDVAFQRSIHEGGPPGGIGGDGRDDGGYRNVVGAYGTVITAGEEDSDVLVWDVATLREHLKAKPDMERNMKYCLSDHLVKSLLRQREASHKRQREQQERQPPQQRLGRHPA
jgi:CRP-like cAMP-binding protein